MRKIKSKRSKTRKGEYEVFRNGEKIGEIFKSPSEQGGKRGWVAILTKGRLETEFSGSSIGARTKESVLDWFREFFG